MSEKTGHDLLVEAMHSRNAYAIDKWGSVIPPHGIFDLGSGHPARASLQRCCWTV